MFYCVHLLQYFRVMSAQKRPSESSGSGPAEKRRERDGGEEGEGQSTGAAASTAVETVIKLGSVANSVSPGFDCVMTVFLYISFS